MCGIFGFIGNKQPTGQDLRLVASRAAERGPDGFGVAFKESGSVEVFYGDGSLLDSMGLLDVTLGSKAILGHCRLPTQGGRAAKHPFKCGDGWLVHNGNVYNPERYGHSFASKCDTEVVAAEVAKRGDVKGETLWNTAAEMHGQVPFVVAYLSFQRFAAARQGHPLFFKSTEEGFYFSSRSFDGATMLTKSFFCALEK